MLLASGILVGLKTLIKLNVQVGLRDNTGQGQRAGRREGCRGEIIQEWQKFKERERRSTPSQEKERMSVNFQSREIYMCSPVKPRILAKTLGR